MHIEKKKKNYRISDWQGIDIALCFFNGLICGILSFVYVLNILGTIAFFAAVIPIMFKRLYDLDAPPKKSVKMIILFFRALLLVLLIVGIVSIYIYFKNYESPF